MHSRPSIGGSGAIVKPNLKRQSVAPMMSGRPSIGGDGRPSIGGRSSLGRRKSMAAPPRQSLTRRSSVYGNKPKIQDPRPISDKAYQQKNQRTLIAFLTSHHYDSAISMKTISSPTRKDFQHICEFIVRQVDPSFVAFTEGKFEEELISWLKWFKYPANISKQSLFAVGSPHTWPAVCAALVWVIELITVGEAESQEKKVDMDVLSMDREKMFFEYLSNTYTNFLAGEDNHTALEQDLAQVFATRNAAVNDEVARFSAENERLKKEIANLRSVSASVAGLQSRRADLTADLNRFTQLLKKLQEHRAAQEAKAAEREKELRGQEQTLMEAETEKGALERALAAQEFSPLEVQRMHQERSMLEDGLRTLAAQKEDLQKRTWELEIAVAKRLDEVERHVMEYNERATQLQLVPASARFASGLDLSLALNPQAPSADEMLSVDLRETVKPILTRLKDEFAEKIRVAQTELREESLKEEQLRASCNEKAEEVADLESRLRKFETVYQEEKETHARELKAVVARVEDLEIDVRRMRTDTASQVDKAEKLLAQLEEERNQLELGVEESRAALHDEVLAVLEAVTQHKVDVNETLHGTLRRVQAVRDQLAL